MVLSRHVQLGFNATRATDEIRILGVVSSPRNIKEKVIADPVIDQLEEFGRQRGDGEAGESWACFEVLRQPTRQLFKEKLKSHRPHVLHFAGHGKLERDEGFIGLCLEETDRVDWLRGSDLPDLLGERRRLRLVVLHACEGAASSGLDGILDLTRRREERRLAEGRTYEPRTFYEKNATALAAGEAGGRGSSEPAAAAWVTCEPLTVG